jgi:glycosyltransferase involved in cell wall biosynthesis
MDILFVLPEFPPQYGGGIATYYDTLIPAVAAQGHDVDVLVGSAYTSDHSSRQEPRYSVEFLDVDRRERTVERFTAYEALPPLRRTLGAAWALFEQANRGDGYDVVETTDFGLLFLPWVIAESSPPVLVQLHASNGQIDAREPKEGGALQGHFTRLLEMQGLAEADELQTHSHKNVQAWSERLGREVGYFPPPLAAPPDASTDLELENGESEGFVAGRIQYWKGPTVLCEAQAQLGDHAPDIDWAGRDTDYRAVGQSMSDYLLDSYPTVWGESVRPIGEIPPGEVVQRQRAAQFVVVPSIWDVFNYTAVEAMREGTVVICSDGAGASDVIDDGDNGFVVPAQDEGALAEAISAVCALSPKARTQIGRAGRETVEQTLAPQRVARHRSGLYEDMEESNQGAGADGKSWLAEAVRPDGKFEVDAPPLALLDRVPLRKVGRYVLRRTWKKVISD